MTRAALYTRVSTDSQDTSNQVMALRAAAEARNWPIVATFEDAGISGAKGRTERPGLDAMLLAAAEGEFDVLMCWAIDRLGRSLIGLLATAEMLRGLNVELFFLAQSIDTTTPAGKMFFQITGAFAEYERTMIVSRIKAGLARRKANGGVLGRARVTAETEARIRAELAGGTGILKVGRALRVGTGTVARIKQEMVDATARL